MKNMFYEIANEAKFGEGYDIGPGTEVIPGFVAGDAGDWVLSALGIPGAEAELGSWEDYTKQWFPQDVETAFAII